MSTEEGAWIRVRRYGTNQAATIQVSPLCPASERGLEETLGPKKKIQSALTI